MGLFARHKAFLNRNCCQMYSNLKVIIVFLESCIGLLIDLAVMMSRNIL